MLGETVAVPLLDDNFIVAGHLLHLNLSAESSLGIDLDVISCEFASQEDSQRVFAIEVGRESFSFNGARPPGRVLAMPPERSSLKARAYGMREA